jgi:CBS domain-containing protein
MPNREISSRKPLDLYQEIVAAQSIDALRAISVRMLNTVDYAIRSSVGTISVVQLISRFNDAITLRLITLLEDSEGIRLPKGSTFLVLGSEGRGEQTLRTDQDNAIVYCDDLPSGELRNVERFATRLVDALEEIGVPRCPGNIMASNPRWCHSVSEWKKLLNQWITVPTPDHILNFGMFQDLRALRGDESQIMQLRDYICSAVRCNGLFLPNMACHVVRFPAPFTIFGRIRLEQGGKHAGMVDLKKAGIFAITTGASLLALESGIIGGDTWKKLELLGEIGIFSSGDLKVIAKAFTFLVQLRLQQQLRDLSSGSEPTNYIEPLCMTDTEYEQFRQALKGVNTFLWIFRDHYQLDYISM